MNPGLEVYLEVNGTEKTTTSTHTATPGGGCEDTGIHKHIRSETDQEIPVEHLTHEEQVVEIVAEQTQVATFSDIIDYVIHNTP